MATVLFVCLHNAGRSQMSQALFERAAGGRHQALSAGSEADPGGRVHPPVVEVMRELGVDLSDRRPQRLTRELAERADLVVTMGCGDACPVIPGKRYRDWELPDPKGRPLEEVRVTRDEIARRVAVLVAELDRDASTATVAGASAANALRDQVRDKYAAAAVVTTGGGSDTGSAACCDATGAVVSDEQREQFGNALYSIEERGELPEAAVLASLGCGNPIAIAELHRGETVLDLGSGGGIDVLLSAKRVGPTGLAFGLDMTDEMLDLARRNQAEAGVSNVQWLRGHIEHIPLPAGTVDVIISNCVINLSADKPQVLREAARVLRPGGRFAVSDVVADDDMDDSTRRDMQAYTGCIAGALTRDQFTEQLHAAGLTDVTIEETHRVHPAAVSAIVRASKPAPGCCTSDAQTACCEPAEKDGCCDTASTASGGCGCQ